MKNWDKILKDFSHKCKGGEPDFTNSTHLNYLRESILKYDEEFRNNTYALNEFIGNLRNGKEVIVEKRKPGETWKTKSGWAGLKAGEEDARYGMDSEETAVAYVSGQEVGGEEDEGGGKRDDDDSGEGGETKSPSIETSNKNKADRKERFSRGWESGAPGRPGSMLNEEGSNSVSEQMYEDDSLTEEQAVNNLLKELEGTRLEEQNQSSTIAGDLKVGDLPPDTPTEKRGIVSKAVLAVRNAKRKTAKAKKQSEKLGWKNTKLMNFGGEQSDKEAQKEFLKGKKVVAFKNGKKVVIPAEKVNDLIDTAGGGKNPSDTSSIIVNEDTGEVTLLFHSDKDSRGAQTGNSTQREELTGKATQRALGDLKEKGQITDEQEQEILDTRAAYAQRIDEIEDEFITRATNVSRVAMERLDSGEVDAQDVIDNFKNASGKKGDSEKYWRERVVERFDENALNGKKKNGEPDAKAVHAKYWLEQGNPDGYDDPPTEEQMLRAYLKKNSEEVPTGKDKAVLGRLNSGEDTPARRRAGTVVKGFEFTPDSAREIEEIRTRALEMELQQKEELNETKIEVDGQEIGMGDYLSSESIWDFAHMDMLTQTEGTVHEYDDMFEVNMSGHYLNKEVLSECLGVNKKTDFQKRFYTGDLVAQTDTKGNVTGAGKIIYFMKGEKRSDDDMAFQEKKIRTKQGPESKASTVYNNGSDLKDCIDKNGKV